MENEITLKHVLITHWHLDHLGGVPRLESKLKELSQPLPDFWKIPLPEKDNEMIGDSTSLLKDLRDQREWEVQGANLTLMESPGHTEDHACFVLNYDILFAGDAIIGTPSGSFENLNLYLNSL